MIVMLKCILCDREGASLYTIYHSNFIQNNRKMDIPLCKYHYACYRAHHIKKLDILIDKT